MGEGNGFTMWRYRGHKWDRWRELENDLQWLVFKEKRVEIEGLSQKTLNHWRWHRAVVAFRWDWSQLCYCLDAMPAAELESWGWWWCARLAKPAGDDEGVRA